MEGGIHIALKAEKIAEVFGFPITNTMLMAWIVMLVIGVTAYFVGKNIQRIPSKTQTFFELVFSFLLDYMEEVLESRELARRFFPLITTLFFFILIGNWFGLIPGIGSIYLTEELTFNPQSAHAEETMTHPLVGDLEDVTTEDEVTTEHAATGAVHAATIALFHPVSVDLNFTLALAIIAFFAIEISGILYLGVASYAGKFFNFSSPINFLVGIIELISELARLVSFSFRLFGNMFAGKTLILVAMFFVPFVLPVPLMLYEVFVGFIQASIFALLTLFFIKLAISTAH